MIERGKNVKTSSGINIVSNHFIKNGIYETLKADIPEIESVINVDI